MPAETDTAPTALGGTNNSPDEPASNRAMKDPAMARIPRLSPQPAAAVMPGLDPRLDPGLHALPSRHSRASGPGPRPATAPLRPTGGREPAPDPIRGRGPVASATGRVRWASGDPARLGPPTPDVPHPPSAFPAEAGTHSSAAMAVEAASALVPSMTLPSHPPRQTRPGPRPGTSPGLRPGNGDPRPAPNPNREPASGPNKGPHSRAAKEIPPREILFVDPGVADIATLLGHLRPEVEAILLDPARPAARQIAAAVAGRHGLDAVHVIAHGAPGRVSFAAGDWSAATLEEEAADLAAIGQALGAGRNVYLWSCQTAAGPAGAAFIAGLARASGADIAAATGRVGAAAFGGGWELIAASPPRPGPPAALSRRHCPICGSIGDKEQDRPGGTLGDPTSGDWSVAAPTVILAPSFPPSLSRAATRERVSSCDPSSIIGKPSPGV
jgi:hypothetical protein